MPKTVRIKATPQADKNIHVKLEQDFDLLEILSLKISKSDIYTRMCAEYGVIVGRALANSGFGIPNAKISVFVPLTKEDEKDPVISQLYPYKQVNDKNEEGYRYNLLPKTSEGCNHKATGSFFTAEEAINNPIVVEVFEKYYKYTTKTNNSGDFMLWGIPLGVQTVHASIDVSDIGCYSMRPYQFIKEGVSPAKFESSLEFKSSNNLDTLPQIIIQNKVVDVVPFWGDDELCNVGITRTDFDLRDSGVEIIPSATFMGSIITDEDSNYVHIRGDASRNQGNLCSLTTGTGTIEAVRHTILKEEDGCTPKLEYFNLEKGGKVIDGDGSWVIQVPMNLEFVVTNEYGEQVISNNPKVGIPTEGKYRFRISFDANSGENRKGSYLVPNIREYELESNPISDYTNPITGEVYSSPSYTFSDKLINYPLDNNGSWENSPAYKCEDYFYHFEPNKVYTIANFIDNYRKRYDGEDPRNSRWNFIGIKSINPPPESTCADITKEFPSNDVFRGGTMFFTAQQLLRTYQIVTVLLTALTTMASVILMFFDIGRFWQQLAILTTGGLSGILAAIVFNVSAIGQAIAAGVATTLYLSLMFILLKSFYFVRRLYNFPSCEPCSCGAAWYLRVMGSQFATDEDEIQETHGEDNKSVGTCSENPYMTGYANNNKYWQGKGNEFPRGCYVITWTNAIYGTLVVVTVVIVVLAIIPMFGPGLVGNAVAIAAGIQAVVMIVDIGRMLVGMNQWRMLADIYMGLCQGVFNMKFSNNWVNGVLYHFRFMRKTRKVDSSGSALLNPVDLYPDRVIWRQQENDTTYYYYRSCPFTLTGGFSAQNVNVDPSDDWPLNSVDPEKGEEHCGINFPTTIVDLGPLDPCITELCSETGIANPDECFFVDKLKPSSYQPTQELLGRIIQQKVGIQDWYQFRYSGINKWFGPIYVDLNISSFLTQQWNGNVTFNERIGSAGAAEGTGRLIDGDIAQLIATNSMLSISTYTTDNQDPYYGLSLGGSNQQWYDQFGPQQGGIVNEETTQFHLLVRDNTLLQCLTGDRDGLSHTQVVPSYIWNKQNQAYGTLHADYIFDSTCTGTEIHTMGYQQGYGTYLPHPDYPEGTNSGDWSSPPFYALGPPATLPPLGIFNTTAQVGYFTASSWSRLGSNLFFYFGLRQGASSYDKFINEYLPPGENE